MQQTVTQWLDKTALAMPNKTAICDETSSISFYEYRSKAIGIAQSIIDCGAAAKTPVVVFIEKSLKVLASFMGVAYSGCFYSPIDVDMPESRIQKILEVLNPAIVITTAELKSRFESYGYSGKYIIYEDVVPIEESAAVSERSSSMIDTDLLYVLFTSGSTGTPKGVCITHRGVIDFIDWVTETFNITEKDAFGNQAPFYFDNSILDIYSTAKTGATLYVIPKVLFSQPVKLLEYIKNNCIDTIFWVPSALMIVSKLKALDVIDLNGTLKNILFAGEVMPNKQLNIWRRKLPNAVYANLYGPTEITDICTYYIVNREFDDNEPLPIGFPTKNMNILVLDNEDKLITKPDVPGELCVRGTGVSPGYYNNPEKTRAAFVPNPLNTAYNEIIYRTGDIVQYNARHEIIYLSRKDFQIKHMGHRIELGEIETAASSLEGITSCCCLYDEKRSRITLFIDKEKSREEINSVLNKMIPEYMLPGKVIFMENMPLNANGKIDRVKLKEYI